MKRALRTKSVGTKVSEAELRVPESRAAAAGLTLSEWVRDVLLGSSVNAGTMAAERAILAEVLAMRAILLNFMLKLSARQPITEQISRELIAWADENKMRRAMEILAKSSTREERMQSARPEPELPKAAMKVQYHSGSASAFGMSVVRLHGSASNLSVTGFYTPEAWVTLNGGSGTTGNPTGCGGTLLKHPVSPYYPPNSTLCTPGDLDIDAGGVILARPTGASSVLPPADNFAVLAGGKEGVFYVLSPSAMKNNNAADTVDPCTTGSGGLTLQCFSPIILPGVNINTSQAKDDTGSRCGPAFWPGNSSNQENILYVAGSNDSKIRGFQMNTSGNIANFNTTQYVYENAPNPVNGFIGYPGNCPVVSWNSGTGSASDAILWILDTSGFATAAPAQLFAYQALPPSAGSAFNLKFSDTTNGPGAVQFTLPAIVDGYIIAAGAVQVGGGACSTPSCHGKVVVWH